jgi:GT2 family glycosyltransferase
LLALTPQINVTCIIDNGSSDDSLQVLTRQYKDHNRVTILANDANVGFGPGIETGIRSAIAGNADYVLLVNNDALLDKQCLQTMLNCAESDETIGIVGPRIFYFHRPATVWQGGGYFNYFTGGNVVPEKNKDPKAFKNDVVEASFLTGCVMLIRCDVFKKIGFFAPEIFFYEEDVDFCLRARKAGFRLVYLPNATAWHKVEGIRITPFAFYNRARSRLIAIRRNFGLMYQLYGFVCHFLLFSPYKMYQCLSAEKKWETFSAWWKGTVDGLTVKLTPQA